MRKALLFTLTLLTLSPSVLAWEIKSFDADLIIQPDGSLLVTERIHVDFKGEARHGIYRDIPAVTQTRMGIQRSIQLKFIGAIDENARPWGAKLSREGAYLRIRLGSQDVTYGGEKNFNITYRVERILESFPDHDELYWNVTGTGWAVPIRSATATVRLPYPVKSPEALLAAAYTGPYASTAKDAEFVARGNDTLYYFATRPLGAFEGLTIVAGWPRGLVPTSTKTKRILWFFEDNWPLGIPIFVLFFMFRAWWHFGRDPKKGPITVQYEPPQGLTPGEVGALVDDKVDLRDITATVIDLARRGYLTIKETSKKDYELKSNPSADLSKLKPHEQLTFKEIFKSGNTVDLTDLENEFYEKLSDIRKALYEGLVKAGFWRQRPDLVRSIGWGVAIAIAIAAFFGSALLEFLPIYVPRGEFAVSLVLTAGIIAIFSCFMPQKTLRGTKALENALGLEEFIRRVDKDRLRRETDLESLFEKILPFAMALGLAGQWGKAFEGVYDPKPTWYSGYDGGHFSSTDFSTRMQNMSGRMGTVFASAPRSSGGSGFSGGFSGGGGGGGGGGAW
ncbi:MAG: DUF2207 domain-containing protein [Candidatus Omnitrophica bacterium]|nr:DUF2207 domain-containing protein [Candidatus Omnitrophota bacterium]